jgi:hypothetical protein
MRAIPIILVCSLTPALQAEEPTPLRWNFKEGDTFYTRTQIKQQHTMSARGRMSDSSLTFDFSLRYKVKAAGLEETLIEVTYLSVAVSGDGIRTAKELGDTVRGSSITLKLNPQHALTGVRGCAAILEKFQDAAELDRDTAVILFGEAGVREIVGRPFVILPREGLRVKQSVTCKDRGRWPA